MLEFASRGLHDEETEALNDERKLNDIVDKMCISSTNEERTRLASQLRVAVDCITDIGELNVKSSHTSDHAAERGPAVAALNRRLQALLTSDEQSDRLAAIAAFTVLINTESESIHARAQRAANAVRVLFQTPVTDIATAKAAAGMVGALSNVNSALSARAVEHVLTNSINLIGSPGNEEPDPQLSNDRARSAMIIAELAGVDKAPKFVFRFQEKLRKALWDVVWDRKRSVREQGVQGLQAILKTVIVRGDGAVGEKAMSDVMEIIRHTLSPNLSLGADGVRMHESSKGYGNMAVVHGSLSMVASLLSSQETAPFMQVLSSELCTLSLRFQKSSDPLVRQAVAEILPLLVRLDRSLFEGEFLNEVHESTLELINNRSFPAEERGKSLVSLAATAEQMPTNIRGPLLEDMLTICTQTLSAHMRRTDAVLIPKLAVLQTISHLAKASKGNEVFEKSMREGMLSLMFGTDFTSQLVITVDDVGRAVPSLVEFIRERLVNLIAATLRSRIYDKDIGLMTTMHERKQTDMKRSRAQLARKPSSSTLNGSSRASVPHSSHDRLVWNKSAKSPPSSSPLDFFKQYPFSPELHRIDSGAALASNSSSCALEGLVKSLPGSEASSPSFTHELASLPSLEEDPTVDKENSPCVALKAIVSYDFTGMKAQDFTSFANEFVIGYVESNSVKVRALAVAASAKLMESAATVWAGSRNEGRGSQRLRPEIQSILAQLLLLSVGDPSTDVRFVAIRSLDRKVFYQYLLQPEMLSTLFVCLYDSSLAMRNSTLALAGRLSEFNPAHILPALRKFLMHLLTSLKLDGDYFERDRRDATKLIYTLVHSSRRLVEPYTNALMDALLIRLQEAKRNNDTGSALPVLLTIAEMGGTMNRIDLKPYRAALVPLIVSSVLQVQSAESAFRRAALRALSALVQNTGFVIKPYVEHPALLPGLLELLRVETDASVRLEAETLIGSLGAVDPDDHKYAAMPMFAGSRPSSRSLGNGSQGRSLFRLENPSVHGGSHWGTSAPRVAHQTRGSAQRLSGLLHIGRQRQPQTSLDVRGSADSRSREGRVSYASSRPYYVDARLCSLDLPEKLEDVNASVSLFALGGARLGMIAGYTPVWDRDELENVSLVGQLEHPFTASPDYFPSVALDQLHNIIGNPRLRVHDREACQAIVNILKSVGPKCSYFLPAVVPRILWLLAQSSRTESAQTLTFTQLQQHVMQRLGDIVTTAGYSFLPYTFDTVLLTWYYLKNIRNSAACIASVCGLLSRLRRAIGDEFKPIIATVLPPLLAALAQDRSTNGAASKAVLRALESFSPLFEEYGIIVLVGLTRAVSSKRASTIRQEALAALIRIIEDMPNVEVLSCVVHPLVQILAGVADSPGLPDEWRDNMLLQPMQEGRSDVADDGKLAVLAASALIEIENRSSHGFNIFVPVIAKALKFSMLKRRNERVYSSLERLLLKRSPDVVGDLLGKPLSETRNHHSLPCLYDRDSFPDPDDVIHELLPVRRGGALDGQALLPRGTRMPVNRVHILEYSLTQKWEVDHSFTSEDWVKWIADLGATMFEQSGSPAFRACVRISESYPQFTRHLFNAAFLSCWTHPLSQDAKNKIYSTLERALVSETIPLTVLQMLLSVFEYMDHDEKPLQAATENLAWTACKCGAFAKAVRYREQDYAQHLGKPEKLEHDINGEDGLIAIYEKLGHIESAVGTITHYQNQTGEKVKEKWFEKLRRWDDALKVYENEESHFHGGITETLYHDKRRWENTLGRLRCLNEIGEWRKMNDLLLESRRACIGMTDALRELALEGKGVSVALDLGRWREFEEWVGYLRPDSFEGCLYNTILLVRRGKEDASKLDEAERFLHDARCKLDLELTARVSEGYPRAYAQVVEAQILVELEEMISFLRMPKEDDSFGRQRLRDLWDDRLRGCKHDRYTWYRLLMIRTLVMAPIENKANWLDFATMCRKAKRLPMASEALRMLLVSFVEGTQQRGHGLANGIHNPSALVIPPSFETWDTKSVMTIGDLDIKFACIKHLWAINRREEAYNALETCRNDYLLEAGMIAADNVLYPVRSQNASESKRILAGEVFSKLSKWGHRLIESGEVESSNLKDPLVYADHATKIRPRWYKAWHYWAALNASRFETMVEGKDTSVGPRIRSGARGTGPTYRPNTGGTRLSPVEKTYITQAVRGYFRAIDLAGKSRLEDSLKVLTLWFNYGGLANMHQEFDKGFRETNIAMWLEVVPQIIARLYTPFPEVQQGVKKLLTRIGSEHPHVAVYPLTVAKSTVGSHQQKRTQAAREILEELKQHHEDIVEQAEMVATELVRVAVLWTETWYENLEEASKMYFVNHNIDDMLDTLLPLHEELERGGETSFEKNFKAEFGAELREAGELCRKFRIEHRRGVADDETLRQYLHQAWVLYHHVFRKIQRQQQGMHVLDLAHVSNGLNDASGLMLAVPGTYVPDENVPIVGIRSFNSQLSVIQSKQRPRKMSIIGSNGHEYKFLLKGHEDLRQDERVMQVFGLINKLFAKSDQRAILRGVGLKMYSVIALSNQAGLIEWVPNCDTMHALVKEYREVRKVMPNIEHRVMLRIAPEPDRLPLLHKVDLFEFMLQNTGGVDIAKVLWLKSRSSEMWLDRRTTYAKSLATTSMTGYLLGLGDRHPSNLMIERDTGKIMHIDFGDCFEVAMKREKYPEKVPFRLTRMLVEALEPCGVDGYFRHTSEATIDVLRQPNARESLMSMMEAFVYDPLIRWKLIGAEELVQIRDEAANELPVSAHMPPASVVNLATLVDSRGVEPDLVRSLRESGSLSASMRALHVQQQQQAMDAGPVYPGAIPTPASAQVGAMPLEDDDPADMRTPNQQARMDQQRILREGDPAHNKITAVSNSKAQVALSRFADKLCGTDFDPNVVLKVPEQVDLLIREAQNIENLCQLFLGWCAFW